MLSKLKQDEEVLQTMKQHIIKVETIEGIMIYINAFIEENPQTEKVKFNFGSMHIFKEDLKINCFKGELVSFDCLNKEMNWTQKYFSQIHKCFEKKQNDIQYSLAHDPEAQIACDQVLRITQKLELNERSSTEVILLKVYLKYIPSLSNLDTFYRLVQQQIISKNQLISQLEKKIETGQQQRTKLINDMEHISHQSKQNELLMKQRFVLLLNEKKAEIRRLNQMNGLINHNIIIEEQQQNQKQEAIYNQIQNQMQQEPNFKEVENENHQIKNSQYMVSQLSPSIFFTQDAQLEPYQKKLKQ